MENDHMQTKCSARFSYIIEMKEGHDHNKLMAMPH